MPLITDNRKQIENLLARTEQGQAIVGWILSNPRVTREEIAAYILSLNDTYSRLAQKLINEQDAYLSNPKIQ